MNTSLNISMSGCLATSATMLIRAQEAKIPMGHISLSVEMMADVYKNENDLKLYLDVIEHSTMRVNDILNELIAYLTPGELDF